MTLQAVTIVPVPWYHGTTVPTVPRYKLVPWYLRYLRYHGPACTSWYRCREKNLVALPTLDMYLPLSKFESIHWVYIALPTVY